MSLLCVILNVFYADLHYLLGLFFLRIFAFALNIPFTMAFKGVHM